MTCLSTQALLQPTPRRRAVCPSGAVPVLCGAPGQPVLALGMKYGEEKATIFRKLIDLLPIKNILMWGCKKS